ncbi:MAG TPA: hypothetical protein VES79_03020 [Solirubrobacteraceae bacterium]|nr:hypothetical protein [Solirubrobacteraceae bacterium]
MRHIALALAALSVAAPPAAAAPGDLDPSFSSDGRVTTLSASETFVARALAVQGDGRIVVAGYSCDTGTCGPTGDSSFRLTRYTPDGGLDTDFGAGGTVTTTVGAGRSQAFDVVLEPDGSLVAAGVASADGADPGSFALVRYRSTGALDETFGSGGKVVTPIGAGFDAISDLVVQPGGGLIAVGQAEQSGGGARFALARYGPSGALDPGFGSGGSVLAGNGPYAFGAAGAVLPDGGIVAVGASGASSGVEDHRFTAVRTGTQGAAEPASTVSIGSSYSFANAASALADGRVLAAGVATDAAGRPGMALVRLSAAGGLDPGWDGDGVALARLGESAVAADLVLTPDARAVAAGHVQDVDRLSFLVARFAPDGSLDRGFGAGGFAVTSFAGATVARATAIARQPDGRLLAGGLVCAGGSGAQCSGATARLALARYLGDPAPAPPAPAPPAPAAAPPFVGLPTVLRARHGRVLVRVRCLQSRRCRGILSLRRLRSRGRTVLLASRRVSIRARGSKTVSLRLRRGLGRARRIRTRLSFRGRDASGRLRMVTRNAQLRQ